MNRKTIEIGDEIIIYWTDPIYYRIDIINKRAKVIEMSKGGFHIRIIGMPSIQYYVEYSQSILVYKILYRNKNLKFLVENL